MHIALHIECTLIEESGRNQASSMNRKMKVQQHTGAKVHIALSADRTLLTSGKHIPNASTLQDKNGLCKKSRRGWVCQTAVHVIVVHLRHDQHSAESAEDNN